MDWTDHPARTTTERVYRLRKDDRLLDIWGASRRLAVHPFGTYEELSEFPLAKAETLADLAAYDWPTPDWFDFRGLPAELNNLDAGGEVHIRYRIGSLFETAWSLRGFEQTLMDLVEAPEIPGYIMDRILEVHLANLEAAVKAANGRLDMVYYYDDLASMENLLMSPAAYRRVIKPRQEKLLSAAKAHGLPVMYHCDGSIFKLIPDLMEMGVTLLNPIQVNAKDMSAANLKQAFGGPAQFPRRCGYCQSAAEGNGGRSAGGHPFAGANPRAGRGIYSGPIASPAGRYAIGKCSGHVRNGTAMITSTLSINK